MSTAPAIQPFGWALPTSEQNKLKAKNDSPKPFANPLLKASPHHDSIGVQSPVQMRFPFSPVDNTTLRRRKASTVSFQAVRPVFLPPKASLPVDGAFLEITDTTLANVNETVTHEGVTVVPERSDDDSLERWVLVFGYTSSTQFEQIINRFESFGRVTARRGICRPGTTNWVAFQYETNFQAEKALCQHGCLLTDGVLIGAIRLDYSLKASLDWVGARAENSNLKPKGLAGFGPLDNKLLMNEEDVLLLGPNDVTSQAEGKKSMCQVFVEILFGWN